MDISLNIILACTKLSTCGENVATQTGVFQISELGYSFHFITKNICDFFKMFAKWSLLHTIKQKLRPTSEIGDRLPSK